MCCRNTLVCDSVQEAKALAFGGHERHKVVALDGTVFAKAGLITGGTSSNIEARAQKWDEKAMQELRQVSCYMHSISCKQKDVCLLQS